MHKGVNLGAVFPYWKFNWMINLLALCHLTLWIVLPYKYRIAHLSLPPASLSELDSLATLSPFTVCLLDLFEQDMPCYGNLNPSFVMVDLWNSKRWRARGDVHPELLAVSQIHVATRLQSRLEREALVSWVWRGYSGIGSLRGFLYPDPEGRLEHSAPTGECGTYCSLRAGESPLSPFVSGCSMSATEWFKLSQLPVKVFDHFSLRSWIQFQSYFPP